MAQETKVGLLIGLALILLVGLVLSDLFTATAPDAAEASSAATDFGREAQAGIYAEPQTNFDTPSSRRDAFDRLPGFAAEPALDYGRPSALPVIPVESWSPPASPITPAQPTLPELTVEPPLPELDTLEARDAVVRFNDSLEAMRLAVQHPVEVKQGLEAMPTRIEPAPPVVAAVEPAPLLPAGSGTTYIHYVQAGQTLSQIARQHYGNPEFAAAIAQTNPTKVDREGQVRPGARLEIPPLGSPVFSRLFMPVHDEHAVRVEGQPIPALPSRPEGPAAEVLRDSSLAEIEVQPGDTLSALASEHLGSAKRWQELVDANSDQLRTPADLRSGMTLRIPSRDTPAQAQTNAPPVAPSKILNQQSTIQDTYTVQAGDNLTRIAADLLGDGERWDELLAANADQLDRPENLRVGMKLKLPGNSTTLLAASPDTTTTLSAAATPVKTYTVQAGDNLTRIAARKLGDGDRWRELFDANADQLDSPDDLFAGQTLRLP